MPRLRTRQGVSSQSPTSYRIFCFIYTKKKNRDARKRRKRTLPPPFLSFNPQPLPHALTGGDSTRPRPFRSVFGSSRARREVRRFFYVDAVLLDSGGKVVRRHHHALIFRIVPSVAFIFELHLGALDGALPGVLGNLRDELLRRQGYQPGAAGVRQAAEPRVVWDGQEREGGGRRGGKRIRGVINAS